MGVTIGELKLDLADLEVEELDLADAPRSGLDSLGTGMTEVGASTAWILCCSCCIPCCCCW
jgi:hypothetical protein